MQGTLRKNCIKHWYKQVKNVLKKGITLQTESSTSTRRNLGFFHYPNPLFFSEMGQSLLLCNLYGFNKKVSSWLGHF
jgi:hypothetical protein